MSKRRLQMQKPKPTLTPTSAEPEVGKIVETILLPQHILGQTQGLLEPHLKRYRMGALEILVGFSQKSGYHISVAGQHRYPTWEEIRQVRYTLGPKDRMMGVMLPPLGEDIKTGPHCIHLWEVVER